MIIALIVVGYIISAIIAGRYIYNMILDDEYAKILANPKTQQNYRYSRESTVEEYAFLKAKVEMTGETTGVVVLSAWFWPAVLICAGIFYTYKGIDFLIRRIPMVSSKAERQVKAIVAENDRRKLLEQREIAVAADRRKLIKTAESLGICTDGLEAEL